MNYPHMLKWDGVYGSAHYHVYARMESGDAIDVGEPTLAEFDLMVLATSLDWQGKIVFLSVKSVDGNNVESVGSEEVQWIVPLGAPTNLRVE